jgi:hypothetical protein
MATNGQATLEIALGYFRSGLSIVPVKRDGTKRPDPCLLPMVPDPECADRVKGSWEFLQYRLPTEEELRTWFDRKKPAGIGIIGGKVSGNVECLDFDEQAEEIFPAWRNAVERERHGLISILSVVKTPKPGYHVRYRCEASIPGNLLLAAEPDKRKLIETRGEGGYALAPGCPAECHETGRLYVHFSGPELANLSTITASEREVLIRCARSFDRSGKSSSAKQDTPKSTPEAPDCERAWKYIDKIDRSVSGQGGHGQLWAAARALVGFGLSDAEARDLLQRWNAGCRPEWSEKDIDHKIKEARTKATHLPKPNEQQRDDPGDGLAVTCLDTIRPAPVRFLVRDFLPLGKLVLTAGDGGHGKTTLMLDLTACLTTGRPCFGLEYPAMPACEALLVSCEDDFHDTVVPRLLSADADLSKIFRVDGVKSKDGKAAPFTVAQYAAIEAELARRPNVKLVVVDPAGAYVGATGVDDHKESELRALLAPLAELMARRQVTMQLVKHLIKGATAKAVHRVSGSAGYVNSVRAAFVVAPDKDDEQKKLLLPLKFNIGPKPIGIAFRMAELSLLDKLKVVDTWAKHLENDDRERLGSQLYRIQWEGQVDDSADDVLGERRSARADEAADWLKTFLAEFAYPSEEIIEAGKKAGLSRNSLFEGKKKLEIKASKYSYDGDWWWGIGLKRHWRPRPPPKSPEPPKC